jgi:ribosomal protein S18 acetylase RimI-like enzyme
VNVTEVEIRVARDQDAKETAQLLARAFGADPVFAWLCPAEGSRPRRLRRYFLTELRHRYLRHGAVELATLDGRLAGSALWLPPGSWSEGSEGSSVLGYLRAFGRRIIAAGRYQFGANSAHPKEEPSWYLGFIGVDPVRQGQGVGAALLRSRLIRCDQAVMPVYLESSNSENISLYQHFGFKALGTLSLPEGAPVVTTMWRPGKALQ